MVLAWSGSPVPVEALVDEVYLPARGGTLQPALVAAAREHGRVPLTVGDLAGLLAEVGAGRPLLVLQDLGAAFWKRWHYAVVVGYDLEAGTISLHSGQRAADPMDLRLFERSWSRADHWALLVLPPDQLPLRDEERAWLQAVAGLERVRPAAASRGYQAATRRWPGSLPAWLGLGNARYAGGDLAGAEIAFARATALHPDSGAAWNNLAQVRLERGNRAGARTAVDRALALGGPHLAAFEATRREIDAGD